MQKDVKLYKRHLKTLICNSGPREATAHSQTVLRNKQQLMPESWKTYKLEDLVTKLGDGIHGTPKYSEDGEYHFINGNNLVDGKIFIKPETKRVSKKEYIKHKRELNERTLLVSINGTIGKTAYYQNEKVMLGKSACYFNVKEGVNKKFIKQVISSKYFIDYLESNYTGSVIKNVSLKSMRELPIHLPPLKEQNSIASILSALDDKIELNLQMNKTLEEMAMALYKHWFVDFGPFQDGEFVDSELGEIPKGWNVKRLDSVLEIKYGKDHKKLEEGAIPVYGTGGIMRYVNQSLYDQESILIPRKGSLNNLYYLNKPFWTVDTLFYSKIKQKGFGKYVFHFLKTLNLASMDVGSAVPSLTTQLLNRIDIIIPPNIEVLKYEESANIWYNTILLNIEENQTLTKFRDILLPKLISGEVRVKDVEKTLSEVL